MEYSKENILDLWEKKISQRTKENACGVTMNTVCEWFADEFGVEVCSDLKKTIKTHLSENIMEIVDIEAAARERCKHLLSVIKRAGIKTVSPKFYAQVTKGGAVEVEAELRVRLSEYGLDEHSSKRVIEAARVKTDLEKDRREIAELGDNIIVGKRKRNII